LIALDHDRAMRNPRDLEDLIDLVEQSSPRIPIQSVTGSLRLANDGNINLARVMCAAANRAARDTARRVAAARRHQAEAGQYSAAGRRPFGFGRDGKTINPAEAAEIVNAADAVCPPAARRAAAMTPATAARPATHQGRRAPG